MIVIRVEHDLHRRRGGRNAALGLVLGGFVVLILALTVVKLTEGGSIKGFDYVAEPQTQPAE